MVTYGKTVAGGLPVGVLCGRSRFMRRFREDRPADVCLARGTFNAHPYVMGSMYEFLQRIDTEPVQALYRGQDALWDSRRRRSTSACWRPDFPCRSRSVFDLDHLLPATVALQLDVSILPAGGRLEPELGRHGPADLQPELHGCRLRGRLRRVRERRPGHAGGRLVVADPHRTNKSIRRNVFKEMLQARWFSPGSMSSPRIK